MLNDTLKEEEQKKPEKASSKNSLKILRESKKTIKTFC